MASFKPRGASGKIIFEKFTFSYFLEGIRDSRKAQGDIQHFDFMKERCKILTSEQKISDGCKAIAYWMSRDCRTQDNWALLYAQKLARKYDLPLYIFVFLNNISKLKVERHAKFFVDGLKAVESECEKLNICFNIFNENPSEILELVETYDIGAVICEMNPLKEHTKYEELLKELNIPLIQVDAHNVVPVWVASNKQEYMAKTIRSKLTNKLAEFLTGFPVLTKHEYSAEPIGSHKGKIPNVNAILPSLTFDKKEIQPLSWAEGGPEPGLRMLLSFLSERLHLYGEESSDPSKNATSNLSAWLNFGHISAQRVALEVQSFKDMYEKQVDKFMEELIIRKELADNFCYYNENYDKIIGATDWAQKTLNDHRADKRTHIYTKEQLEASKTHDNFWNAAQIQLVKEGKMHGYMRMYWAKKILEWTKSPEEALDIALYLNDYYSLDGFDPNGVVGVMWSVCGVHDQGWKERPVFGKIRYMVDYSLKRKYDMDSYCAQNTNDVAEDDSVEKGPPTQSRRKKRDLK